MNSTTWLMGDPAPLPRTPTPPRDRILPVQLTILTLKLDELLGVAGRGPGQGADIDLGLSHPVP